MPDIKPTIKQWQFANDISPTKSSVGGTGSGKSFGGGLSVFLKCMEVGNLDVAIIGTSYVKHCRQVLMPMLEQFYPYGWQPNYSAATCTWEIPRVKPNRLNFYGAGSISDLKQFSGASFDVMWIDEAVDISFPVFEFCETRLRGVHLPTPQLIITTRPSYPTHPVKQYLDKHQVPNYQMTPDDNPYLPDAYKDRLKEKFHGGLFDIYWNGLWSEIAGSMFQLLPSACRIDPDNVPALRNIVAVVDPATAIGGDYFALVVAGTNGQHTYILDVIREQGVSLDRMQNIVLTTIQNWPIDRFYVECAGMDAVYQHIRKFVPHAQPVNPKSRAKEDRALPLADAWRNGNVIWALADNRKEDECIQEFMSFPCKGVHDDVVDACAYAYQELQGIGRRSTLFKRGLQTPDF